MTIRSSVAADAELVRRVAETIRSVEPGARVILYGSRARGDAEPDSDWDFLVLLDGRVDQKRAAAIRHHLFDLELALDECPVLSTAVQSEAEWNTLLYQAMPYHENVTREGVEL